jgi:signal recognition particle subunit SRP54
MVSVDIYRPAARKHLSVVAQSVKLPVFEGQPEGAPLELATGARREATETGRDVVLVDTAGRLHIDDALMKELEELRAALSPTEILYVADAMTGQDAVRSAEEFHKRMGITGVVLTKMDGDARGGGALSIRHVTGQPVKFVGVGEKFDALEPFHPDRIASRILGMGDVLSLIEKVEQNIDQKKALELQQKIVDNDFSLQDFRDQLRQLKKLGPIESILSMLPQVGPLKGLQGAQIDPKELTRLEAIIDSMTLKERLNHQIVNGSRRRRIARGSGTSVQEVNQLLKQYSEMRRMMKSFSGGMFKKRLRSMMR